MLEKWAGSFRGDTLVRSARQINLRSQTVSFFITELLSTVELRCKSVKKAWRESTCREFSVFIAMFELCYEQFCKSIYTQLLLSVVFLAEEGAAQGYLHQLHICLVRNNPKLVNLRMRCVAASARWGSCSWLLFTADFSNQLIFWISQLFELSERAAEFSLRPS